jgi:hypothetical protein
MVVYDRLRRWRSTALSESLPGGCDRAEEILAVPQELVIVHGLHTWIYGSSRWLNATTLQTRG